ncbi:MAG: DUF1572 family protein [Gemmatimonadetes bacterium]|nr:DUF1572 family protein [Gemmatimonadota bacterium]
MRHIVGSIEGEYRRYRKLGSDAMAQLTALQLAAQPSPESNSIATIVWHVSGNLTSRFTDFLTEDGEKPWREREEFAARQVEPAELSAKWDRGWEVLMAALDELTDMDLERTVRIRGVDLTVTEALHRSLAHTSSHVGQITFLAKMLKGSEWTYLSIPPGGTAAYNANPTLEKS